MYEVHESRGFVEFPSLGASLYWAYLKLVHRAYAAAFSALAACTSDAPLSGAEHALRASFRTTTCDDRHPDAHACRLNLRLALVHVAPDALEFDEEDDIADAIDAYEYFVKRERVSCACRLSLENERAVLEHIFSTRARRGASKLPSESSQQNYPQIHMRGGIAENFSFCMVIRQVQRHKLIRDFSRHDSNSNDLSFVTKGNQLLG